MTRDELDAATDEQLNEMAAKVMGWFVHHRNTALYYPADYTISTKPARFISEWRPSTSIADAWELVEKMAEQGLRLWPVPDWHNNWQGMCYRQRECLALTSWMKSAPRAITTAALLAWGEKENSK